MIQAIFAKLVPFIALACFVLMGYIAGYYIGWYRGVKAAERKFMDKF